MTQVMEKEKTFVNDPMEWPKWPLLPLKKRRGNFHEDDYLGFLFAEGKPRVYVGMIFQIGAGEAKPKTWNEALAPFKFIDYANFDELLAVWEVD